MEKMNDKQLLEILVVKLFEVGIIKFGSFKLKSGILSPFYFDLRPIISFPNLLSKLADAYINEIQNLKFDRIAGIPFTGLPIATTIAIQGNYPMVHCRTKQKEYGTQRTVEGIHKKGDTVLIIDDTITDGASKLESINLFKENQFTVNDVLIFLDRKQGGSEKLKEHSISLTSVCDIYEMLDMLHNNNQISENKYEEILMFFKRKT